MKLFERYPFPRVAVYNRPGEKYNLPGGWQDTPTDALVIGETEDEYVTKIMESETSYWDEYGRYNASYCYPFGFHKSRFIEWKEAQVALF